ncbi:MAG: F0F1 ATP synthase subunit alpha [Oscillospiraceae bacterium]|jgi:F-type H+-transporting ATPase subunit alpha|nr:F0F1 ATP synthase subunit alpha [Oscillospiraceae bacterium]
MKQAVLRAAQPLEAAAMAQIQEQFKDFLGEDVSFDVVVEPSLIGGYVALIDGKLYDMSVAAQLAEIRKSYGKELVREMTGSAPKMAEPGAFGSTLREHMKGFAFQPKVEDYGTVNSIMDDVVQISGLAGSHYGELLAFEGEHYGLALDLREDGVGAVMLSGADEITTGSFVHGTGHVADICVGDTLLGRIINPIGQPMDGRELKVNGFRPVECPAPSIMDRSPVNRPLETGLLAIDSMIPIGRGQRELIIGDRQTGKTSIALAAMINQRDENTYCVYCAIGQKGSTVAQVADTLRKSGALERTVIVAATADDRASLQYLAPYAGCAIAEDFMHRGRDVLIVYDDLSRHAQAYRSMSLLLRRPSGREAYPGDVFYLHSRLLERAAKLCDEKGGGSITALPIVETMAGDISAYIPTNVISITDGQIYLESELFNAGVRPALNVGLSVSRVGRSAQHKAMKAVSGSLRLDLAQYRDTAIFAQFGADIDENTRQLLARGECLTQLLKQRQDDVLTLSQQVAVLVAFEENLFGGIPIKQVADARSGLLAFLTENCAGTMHAIDISGELRAIDREMLVAYAKKYIDSRHLRRSADQ